MAHVTPVVGFIRDIDLQPSLRPAERTPLLRCLPCLCDGHLVALDRKEALQLLRLQ